MEWMIFGGLVVLAAALLMVPGLLVAATLRLRGLYSWTAAPALGLGAVAIWTLLWGGLGLRWGWWAWIILVALLVIAALAVGLVRSPSHTLHNASASHRLQFYAFAGVAIYALIRLIVVLPAIGAPDAVPHLGDSAFHMQGTLLVYEGGDVFPLGGLSDLYTPDSDSTYFYPTVWHGWVSLLLPFTAVAEATNAAVVAVAVILYPLSVVLLAAALRPQSTSVAFFAPLLLIPVGIYPGALAIAFSVYPFSLSHMAVPGAMGLFLIWQSTGKWSHLVAGLLATLGATITQPAGAIFPAFLLAVILAIRLLTWVGQAWKSGRRLLAASVAMAGTVVGAVALVVLSGSSALRSMANFPRAQVHDNPVLAFFDGTVAATSTPWWPWMFFVVAAAVGCILLLKTIGGAAYALTVVTAAVAYIAASGPDSSFRVLTGPWYKDSVRLGSVATVFVVVAAAVALSWFFDRFIARFLTGGQTASLAGIVIIATAATWVFATPSISEQERSHIRDGYQLDDEEFTPLRQDTATLLGRLDEHFGEGERLLAAHGAGGGFVPVYSSMKPMLPLIDPLTAEQTLLATSLGEINANPEICSIIREHNVTAFMADTGRLGREIWGPLAGPPYVDVDEGFELVDQEGTMMVWRITACD